MKVLIVTQYFWPENFRINDLVEELVLRRYEVTVLTGKPNYPAGQVFDEFLANPGSFNSFAGSKIVRVPIVARGKGRIRLVLNYLSFIVAASIVGVFRLRGRSFDVVFVYEPSPATVGVPAVLIGRLKHAPVIFWALDLWPETLRAIGAVRSPVILKTIGSLVEWIYARCELVLGQSMGFVASLKKRVKDGSKVLYFPSWSEDVFKSVASAPASEISNKDDLFNIVFAGNIGEAQDMPAVLEAADLVRNNDTSIRWLIIGDGRMSDWVRNEIEKRRLEGIVIMVGKFPVERMPSFYAHADALLVSLKKDPVFSLTIPGKVQACLMAGIPLLGMLDGEGAAVIEKANAGLCCPAGDSLGLSRNVKLLKDYAHDRRRRLGENGVAYASKEFSRSVLLDRLEAIFSEALMRFEKRKRRI